MNIFIYRIIYFHIYIHIYRIIYIHMLKAMKHPFILLLAIKKAELHIAVY